MSPTAISDARSAWRIRGLVITACLAVSTASSATAEPLPRPTAAYQAELRMRAGGLALTGTIHHAFDKERRVLTLEGSRAPPATIIIRRDKDVIWVLNPQARTYYSIPVSPGAANTGSILPSVLAHKTAAGNDTVEGIAATKYAAIFEKRGPSRLVGQIWVSPERILLRVNGKTVYDDRPARPFHMALEDLEIGPQPEALFEVPEDYRLVPPSHPTLGIMAPPPSQNPKRGEPPALRHSAGGS